jgi:hypothetical protein
MKERKRRTKKSGEIKKTRERERRTKMMTQEKTDFIADELSRSLKKGSKKSASQIMKTFFVSFFSQQRSFRNFLKLR